MSQTDSDENESPDRLKYFQPLGEYQWPSTTMNRGFKRFVNTVRRRLGKDDSGEAVDPSHLEMPDRTLLDGIVAPPAKQPSVAELDMTVARWRAVPLNSSSVSAEHVCAIVLPPCDDGDLLRSWAQANSHDLLEPPARDAFDRPFEFPSWTDVGSGILVIPRLEDWFLRLDTGLVAVRDLLSRIDESERRWVVGCNSWAWQFLSKACSVEAVLPEPLVPAAFDAARLRHWLESLADQPTTDQVRFRSTRTGNDAFLSDAEQGDDQQNTMTNLAERSLGIPWVAWHQWRSSLRTLELADVPEGDEPAELEDGKSDELETLWVTELRDFALPDHRNQEVLLVLHALLIHGRLTEDEIHRTVPVSRHSRVVSALVKSGMVRRVDGWHVCVPEAYPAIRDGLKVAGYRMDKL